MGRNVMGDSVRDGIRDGVSWMLTDNRVTNDTTINRGGGLRWWYDM